METMPDFFIKKFRELLVQFSAEEGLPAGIVYGCIPAAAIDADPVAGVEQGFIFASKGIGLLRIIGFAFQPADDLPGCCFITFQYL